MGRLFDIAPRSTDTARVRIQQPTNPEIDDHCSRPPRSINVGFRRQTVCSGEHNLIHIRLSYNPTPRKKKFVHSTKIKLDPLKALTHGFRLDNPCLHTPLPQTFLFRHQKKSNFSTYNKQKYISTETFVYGLAANRTPDLSHAKGTLYH